MTAHHRFMTYTQMEKAYRRILARRMPARQKLRTPQTPYHKILNTVDVNAWITKGPSENLTPQRHMTVEALAKARPLSHYPHTLERIIA
jgi:hypothetical protein